MILQRLFSSQNINLELFKIILDCNWIWHYSIPIIRNMKYILISLFAILIAVSVSILIVLLINKKYKMKGWMKGVLIPLSSLLITFLFVLSYFAFNYPASKNAKSYLKGDEEINLNINHIGIILIIKKMMTPRSSSIVARKLIQSPILLYVITLLIWELMSTLWRCLYISH